MAESLGEAVLRLRVEDNQFKAGVDASRAKVAEMGNTFQSTAGGASVLTSAFAGLSGAVAALGLRQIASQFLGIAGAIIETAGAAQKLNASLTALGGSAAVADQLRNQLFQLSKTTPFKNDEILETSRRFLAVGISTDKLSGSINRLGSLAAQSGNSLDRIGLVYAQIYAKGKLEGDDNLQLLEAGIDLTRSLSKVTGKYGADLQDAMSKGRVSINQVNQAIVLQTGSMAALVLGGMAVDVAFNNIGDNLEQVGLGFSTSVAPAFAAAFGVINNAFDQLFPSLDKIQQTFKPLAAEGQRFADLLSANPAIVNATAQAFESLLNLGIGGAVDGLKDINAELNKNPQGLINGIIQVELNIRRAFLALAAFVKLSQAAGPSPVLGAIFNRDAVIKAISDFNKVLEAKPIVVKLKPVTTGGPTKTDGTLDDKTQAQLLQGNAQKLREAGDTLNKSFLEGQTTAKLIGTEGLQRSTIQGGATIAQAGLDLRSAIYQGLTGPELGVFIGKLANAGLSFKDSLTSGIKQATSSLLDAKQALLGLKLDNARFLNPQERENAAKQLDQGFQAAQQQSGRNINISGPADYVEKEKRAFIDFVKNEGRGQYNVDTLQKGLEVANIALADTNKTLSGNLSALAQLVPGLTEALNAVTGRDNILTFYVASGQSVAVPTGIN